MGLLVVPSDWYQASLDWQSTPLPQLPALTTDTAGLVKIVDTNGSDVANVDLGTIPAVRAPKMILEVVYTYTNGNSTPANYVYTITEDWTSGSAKDLAKIKYEVANGGYLTVTEFWPKCIQYIFAILC